VIGKACKFAAALAFSLAASLCAADYPERPVRLVVPAAPGGAIDIVGRIVGQITASCPTTRSPTSRRSPWSANRAGW